MDADLLRKLINAANQFDTGRVTMDGNENIVIHGDDGETWEADAGTVEEVTETIRKDRMEG